MILIVDKNKDRHVDHEDFWSLNYPNKTIKIRSFLTEDDMESLVCDLLILHLNNRCETRYFEDRDVEYSIVFFSGSSTQIKEYEEENIYYVPEKKLGEFIKNNIKSLL